MRTKTKKRPKQTYIADMEPPRIPKIDTAAENYVEARDQRMKLLKEEEELAAELLSLMHEHGLTVYEFDGRVVNIQQLEKVKVKRAKESTDGDD